MVEILESQKQEANNQFFKFISKNYQSWFEKNAEPPVMSHTLFKKNILPEIEKDQPTLLIVVDNLGSTSGKLLSQLLILIIKRKRKAPITVFCQQQPNMREMRYFPD